jgi:hypothetical protein
MNNQQLKIDLSIDELNLVMKALQELPHKTVDTLLRNLMEQAKTQLGQ